MGNNDRPDAITSFERGPEFWFDGSGKLWFGHSCNGSDREVSLPEAIYEVTQREPVTVAQYITCGLCPLRGLIERGHWVTRPYGANNKVW